MEGMDQMGSEGGVTSSQRMEEDEPAENWK
jgi:hypothetical protein